ncbi:armadillo repeat-containing protein 5 [Cololabis saira]|uniref:armadillo repeat-containing protein 5 n=1 Tax=Cololabis saira TaxID=129043 RepID=UPI002AD35589|nr:armadillo repeat-containing protein 5 [Cololabis saira]
MAASPMKGELKHLRALSKEGHASVPESSLSWCLAHLHKPGSKTGHQEDSGGSREMDNRSKASQWRALVAIRTQHIKGGKAGIAKFRGQGGLRLLMNLLKHPECSRKTLDLALSILANCCTEQETRIEVHKLDGINIIVDIMKRNVALETVQNRAARALANLAMDPESSALIHTAGGVPLLLLCVSLSSAPSSPTTAPSPDSCPKLECAQSAARALLYLSDTPSNRLSLLTQRTLSALAPLIAPEYPQELRRSALRTLHELTKGCGVECAREVSRSGVLAQLGVMASGDSGKPFEELALKTLANMCSQGCLRPLVGSLGVIQKFAEEVKRDPVKSGVFFKALCLCCKEAVNRAKVKESGGLEVLISFLSAHQSHPLSRLAILACVDFVFDESAMEQLQDLGLVPLLIARLVKLTKGEEHVAEKMDTSVSPKDILPSSYLDSFDYPAPEGSKREEAGREPGLCSSSFLSLRSWLLSEGLISSEGDLLDSPTVDGEWGGIQIPPSSSPQSSSPNLSLSTSAVLTTSKKASQPSPVSSSARVTDLLPSSVPATLPQTSSSPVSSPTKTTPITPSKFSSPQRKRRAHSASCLSKVTLDNPPSMSQPAYHHPYHPEPWTPESPILLLLSRFSHASDPSVALVNTGVMSGLLYYLTQHQDPSSRCFRLLCRLSCNPNCLQALVRTGSVALIQHHLCQRGDELQGKDRQADRVKAKVKQLGVALLNNLRVQCESGFGSGVLAHVMLSGSESDKVNGALSLPLITSNRSVLRKLLLDTGGLLLALQPLGCDVDDQANKDPPAESGRLLSDFGAPHSGPTSQFHSPYFSLLIGCLSALAVTVKTDGGKKSSYPVRIPSVGVNVDRDAPPPLKKPRLADVCPYGVSKFDVLLQLDDGTRVPVNRDSVAGVEGADDVGSEYFRALLRGGFGEAQGDGGEAIHIKDVSAGMLIPVVHYLHGCRLSKNSRKEDGDGSKCHVLDTLASDGLSVCKNQTKDLSAGDSAFQKTPLGEAMVAACRFLVSELQRELEDLCVSQLLSCSTNAAPAGENPGKTDSKMDRDCAELAEETLSQASELELTGQMKKLNSILQEMERQKNFVGTVQKVNTGLDTILDINAIRRVAPDSKSVPVSLDQSLDLEELTLRPKNLKEAPTHLADEKGQSSQSSSESVAAVKALASWLPQVYRFSQRFCYAALRRACLSWLLDCPRPFLCSAGAGDCLRRLAREAECRETLKQDLLSRASLALN